MVAGGGGWCGCGGGGVVVRGQISSHELIIINTVEKGEKTARNKKLKI